MSSVMKYLTNKTASMLLTEHAVEAIGCGAGSTKSTVFAFVADRQTLGEVVERAREVVAIAQSNNNTAVVACLGAVDAESMRAARSAIGAMAGVSLVTLAGVREQNFGADCLEGTEVGAVVNLDGVLGGRTVLLLPYGGARCMAAIGKSTGSTMAERVAGLSVDDLDNGAVGGAKEEKYGADWTDDADGVTAINTALDQLGWDCEVVTVHDGFGVRAVTHVRAWREVANATGGEQRVPHISRSFAQANGNFLSLCYAIATGCGSTLAKVRRAPVVANRQDTLVQLQSDVEATLALMLKARPSTDAVELKGVLGPVVLDGRSGDEPLRVTEWHLNDGAVAVLLMPYNYVNYVFSDHLTGTHPSSASHLIANSVLKLPRVARVCQLNSECDDDDDAMGRRAWILELNKGSCSTRYDTLYAQTGADDELSGLSCHFTVAYLSGRPVPVLNTD